MISTEKLLYDIDFKLNKVATNRNQSIPIEDRIIALNLAQIQLIKQKLNINNVYKLGVDSFNKRFDDFKTIIPPERALSMAKVSSNRYLANISEVVDYMFFLKCYILADKGECSGRVLDVNIIAHADTREWMANDHLNPSFDYQETFGIISSDGIEVYTDEIFVPTELRLFYVRYPNQIDYPGYIHFDGSDSILSDCELDEYLRDELVDLAVEELAMSTENVNAYQFSKERITNNE